MNERIKTLIAYDGSTCAANAIHDLPRAGMPREADALIVHVRETWLLPPPTTYRIVEEVSITSNSVGALLAPHLEEPQIKADNKYLEMLAKACARLIEFFPDWSVETLSLQGSPAREVIRQSKEWSADLIVVCSHGLTAKKRLTLGSISQKIVNEAECSVRVVRGEAWKQGSPNRLLIGLDGTSAARAAVEVVAGRMWIMGSEVRLVVARDKSQKNSEWLLNYVEDARKTLERAELSVTESIEEGDPKEIIVAAAEEWGADCIFLGANDSENFYENLLLGSVSTAVVARAHCTVEIVRKK